MAIKLPLRSRTLAVMVFGTLVTSFGAGCSDAARSVPTRTFHMGFSNFPPAPDTMLSRRSVQLWTQRADAAILHLDVPWAALLAGAHADSLVHADVLPIVDAYRAAHLQVAIETDVTNGVDRTAEAPALVTLGRSITEDTVQKLYATYIAALDTLAFPTYLGLASETNLIRLAGPSGVYAAIVAMTNAAAARHSNTAGAQFLYVSVQVDVAWGRLGGTNAYVGIDRDIADFPFINALGLSCYPYLAGFTDPSQIPDDYFSRLHQSAQVPVLITEGGWSSANIGSVHSSPALQAAWIRRASQLAQNANALAWFQLSFTDIDIVAFGLPADDPQLVPFVTLGLVNTALEPKPALAVWDSVFAVPLSPYLRGNLHGLATPDRAAGNDRAQHAQRP